TGNKIEASAKIPTAPGAALDFAWGPPIWDSEGRSLYLLDHTTDRFWQVSTNGDKAEEVVKIAGKQIRDFAANETSATVWSDNPKKTLYVRTHDVATKQDGIYSVDLATHTSKRLIEGDYALSMGDVGAFTGVGGRDLIYSMESATHATDV